MMIRLSILMFFQYFAMGAWYVSATGFMLRSDIQMDGLVFAVYSVGPLAAIFSPFFIGLVADRYLPTQTALAILFIASGILLCIAPAMASPFGVPDVLHQNWLAGRLTMLWTSMRHPFVLVLLGHMLCFMPTISLTASLSFRHLKHREKEFPVVRVLGTIGWICGNVAISFLPGKDASALQFGLAGMSACGIGLYCFLLPSTPPPLKGQRVTFGEIIGLGSLRLFRSPAFTVFIVASFLTVIPHSAYSAFARSFVEASHVAPFGSATFAMAFGQASEIIFMLVMPFCVSRIGVKWMLAIGMAAWVLRFGLFAAAAETQSAWMIMSGILLHGVCFGFFFVTGMMYVDRTAPPAIRNQAQGFLVLVTQGLGMFTGAQIIGGWEQYQTVAGVINWTDFWLSPAIFAAIITLGFVICFRDPRKDRKQSE
ncbi:putative nucleoside transporter YegT [Planctomycetes bacterium CA13]|uniref:Putative nucleoside transporter YegT n=2 Tax=Novipirellula herctigrandis TaxID=2527986 RepID=A0A5C5YMV2_9BACT|nr:putative nucleoside transporter YegT [Planctomycetes bacterium CA13]